MKFFIITNTGSISDKGTLLKTCSEKGYSSIEEAQRVIDKNKEYTLELCDTEEEKREVETRGGKRKGAGRHKSAPTKILTFRVKLDHEQPVRIAVKKTVDRLNKENQP